MLVNIFGIFSLMPALLQVNYTLDSYIKFVEGPTEQKNHFITIKYISGKWYKCDDKTITEIDNHISCTVYLAFYVTGRRLPLSAGDSDKDSDDYSSDDDEAKGNFPICMQLNK